MTVYTSVTGYVASKACSYDGRNGPSSDLGLATSPIGSAPELQELLKQKNRMTT